MVPWLRHAIDYFFPFVMNLNFAYKNYLIMIIGLIS